MSLLERINAYFKDHTFGGVIMVGSSFPITRYFTPGTTEHDLYCAPGVTAAESSMVESLLQEFCEAKDAHTQDKAYLAALAVDISKNILHLNRGNRLPKMADKHRAESNCNALQLAGHAAKLGNLAGLLVVAEFMTMKNIPGITRNVAQARTLTEVVLGYYNTTQPAGPKSMVADDATHLLETIAWMERNAHPKAPAPR